MVTLEHVSGKRLSKTRTCWDFGYGATRNEFGSCIVASKAWTPEMFADLRRDNLHQIELLGVARVRIEAWAHPNPLGHALDALLANRADDMYDADGVRAFAAGHGIAPDVNEVMPLDPAEWRTHPAVVTGVVRCA